MVEEIVQQVSYLQTAKEVSMPRPLPPVTAKNELCIQGQEEGPKHSQI